MCNNQTVRIKVLQFMYGDFEYYPWSERINRHYCKRHGYQYVVSHETPRADRHPTWHRVPMLLNEFHSCDYLLFMDADAFFYSHELTIENELMPLMDDKPILMAQDIGSEAVRWHPGLPNAGVIFLKIDEKVREFIEAWDRSSNTDESICWTWPADQLGLWQVVLPKYPDMVKVHEDYYQIQGFYGQYIRHYFHMTDQERKNKLQTFCELRGIG